MAGPVVLLVVLGWELLAPVTKEKGFGNTSGERSHSLGRFIWR